MARGGYREKAGRKSGWLHPETQVVRIPKAFASQILEIAKKLDSGETLDYVTSSDSRNFDLVTESKKDLVTESIRSVLAKWRTRADAASQKNSDWRKARQILSELEPIVYENRILESVTQSKIAPGQMSLLDQVHQESAARNEPAIANIEKVTDSKSSNDSVTNSEDWLSTRECWEQLNRPCSYDRFRKLSPQGLLQHFGVQSDPQRKLRDKYRSKWLKISNGAMSLTQVNSPPVGSERSEES